MERIAEQARSVNWPCTATTDTVPQPTAAEASTDGASPALLAANARLLALRAARQAARSDRPTAPAALPAAALAALPSHLGWGSQRLTAVLRRQARSGERAAQPHAGGAWLAALVAPQPTAQPQPSAAPAQHDPSAVIRLHPALGLAMLRAKQETAGRIWLLCRHLDRAGRGWLPIATLRAQLATRDAPLHVCGWRRLRQILRAGDGLFWTRDAADRLWLHGTARVAAALHVERLSGRPVLLPTATLVGGIQAVRAQLYAAFHSGRRDAAPISRATLQQLTALAPRTQRAYDQLAGVQRMPAFALGAPYNTDRARDALYRRGRQHFIFTDHHGRQGAPGRRYLAWRLPNSYHGPQLTAARGRQRKINRQLRTSDAALVTYRAQGNSVAPARPARIYLTRGRIQLQRGQTVYWQAGQTGVWHALSPLTDHDTATGRPRVR